MTSTSTDKTIVEAIEDKYGSCEEELAIQIFIPKGAPGQKETGEIIIPQELSLTKCGIVCAGDEEKITDLCGKKVTFLDISENMISEWNEVFKILDAVPMCSFLDLRKNPLSCMLNSELQTNTYPLLSKLVLNDLRLPWQTVTSLLQLFPGLSELHLSLNGYESVELAGLTYPHLHSLHFTCNGLTHWTEVAKLGQAFPNLESLFLLKNPLREFPAETDQDVPLSHHFSKLRCLSVSQTHIQDWDQLQHFSHFPCLTDIRAQGIDFLDEYGEDLRRQLLLAYLPNIVRLNGGKVTQGEKDDAERACIRHYMGQSGTLPQRYHELEAKHGKLDPLVEVQFKTPQYVTVTCQFEHKSFLKRLNVKWTLINLKKELEADLGIPSKSMTVYHEQTEPYLWTDKLIFGKRTIQRYKIEDGHKLIVEDLTKESDLPKVQTSTERYTVKYYMDKHAD